MNVTLHITNATSGGESTFYRALIDYANANARPMRLVLPAEHSRMEAVGAHAVIYHVKARWSPVAAKRDRVLWPLRSEIFDILRAEQPDLVEISEKYTLPLLPAFLRKGWIRHVRRPVVVATSHDRMDDTSRAYFGAPAVWRAISRAFLKVCYCPSVDVHVANSEYVAEELVRAANGQRSDRSIHVLPMGVNAHAFTPGMRTPEAHRLLAERASVPAACARLLLYVGRLGAEKNVPMLVRMMDCLPPPYFLILAGDGPLAPLLRHAGERRRIRLISDVQPSDVAQLYSGADAFVHPNAREAFGMAPLEAMAAGLPLVAPNAGGVLSYAAADNAWLAEPTPDGFAETIMQLFRNPAEARNRSTRARCVAQRHDWPLIAARYFALYDELIASRPCS